MVVAVLLLQLNNKGKQYRLIAVHRYHEMNSLNSIVLKIILLQPHTTYDSASHSYKHTLTNVTDCESVFQIHFFFMGKQFKRTRTSYNIYIILPTGVISTSKTFNWRKFNFIQRFLFFFLLNTFNGLWMFDLNSPSTIQTITIHFVLVHINKNMSAFENGEIALAFDATFVSNANQPTCVYILATTKYPLLWICYSFRWNSTKKRMSIETNKNFVTFDIQIYPIGTTFLLSACLFNT